MENQHRKISGYRELTQEEIDLMNEVKAKGEELNALVEKVNQHIGKQYESACGLRHEIDRLGDSEPYKWVGTARSSLQIGIMELVRSIAQPTTF